MLGLLREFCFHSAAALTGVCGNARQDVDALWADTSTASLHHKLTVAAASAVDADDVACKAGTGC